MRKEIIALLARPHTITLSYIIIFNKLKTTNPDEKNRKKCGEISQPQINSKTGKQVV